jgi:hypothetical protein
MKLKAAYLSLWHPELLLFLSLEQTLFLELVLSLSVRFCLHALGLGKALQGQDISTVCQVFGSYNLDSNHDNCFQKTDYEIEGAVHIRSALEADNDGRC